MSSFEQRRLLWEGGYNIRDLGGLEAADGKRLAWRRLVRADNLGHLAVAGREALEAYGIRTIIDTRSHEERLESPPALGGHATIRTVHAPVARSNDPAIQAQFMAAPDILHWNMLTLQYAQSQIVAVLKHVAHAQPGGTLIHCRVGKDRTGISVAFILELLGVPREQIIADYTASAVGLQPLFEQWRMEQAHEPERFAAFARMLTAYPETMQAVFDQVESQYGGVGAYLREGGWSDADQRVLHERLLEMPSR